jgi:hypothetical protein
VQPDCNSGQTLICRNWKLDAAVARIVGNGGQDLTAITRLENLDWPRLQWDIGTLERGQYYQVINPIKPAGWTGYRGSTNLATTRTDEFHTYNLRIVDGSASVIDAFPVELRRSNGTTIVFSETTDSNGDIPEQEVMTHEQFTEFGFTQYTNFLLRGYKYGYTPLSGVKALQSGRIDEVVISNNDSRITATKAEALAYPFVSNASELHNAACAYLEDNFDGEDDFLLVVVGLQADLGSDDLVVDTSGSVYTHSAGQSITLSPVFEGGAITTGSVTFNGGATTTNAVYDCDVYLNSAQDLTDVTINGNLYIDTGADSVLNFANVTVSGSIFNDATGNTLTINDPAGLLTAGDPGTDNGETNIDTSVIVSVKVTARSLSDGANIQNARVYLEASAGGDYPYRHPITITRSGSTATVTHTSHGLATNDKVTVRGAGQNEYNGIKSIAVIDDNSYTFPVGGSPTTPATGSITSTYVVVEGLTDANGEIEVASFSLSSAQPVSGRVAKATSSPLFKTSPLSGTISLTSGYDQVAILAPDQ